MMNNFEKNHISFCVVKEKAVRMEAILFLEMCATLRQSHVLVAGKVPLDNLKQYSPKYLREISASAYEG